MCPSNINLPCSPTACIALGAITALLTPALRAQPASFQGLGIPPGMSTSFATALSADGRTVIGTSGSAWFRWTAATGMSGFGSTGFTPSSVSADGSTVVGSVGGFQGAQAARWTETTGVVLQGFANGGYSDFSQARGIAADGQTMVGQAGRLTSECCEFFGNPCGYHVARTRAFIQAASQRPMHILRPLEAYSSCTANAVSGDGSTVVGVSVNGGCGSGGPWEACRWIDAGNPIALGFLEGQTVSTAYAVSADGSTVVGTSGGRAFRWTTSGGMVDLGQLPGGSSPNFAYAVSADGSVVIGQSSAAFIWD